MAIVYLAGPMDYCAPARTRELREDACAFLEDGGSAVFDPTGAYQSAMADPAAVMAMNDAAIERCDGLLAVWPPDIMSVGTPYEIFLAHRLGKPVVVIGPTRSMQLLASGIPVFPIEALLAAVERLQSLMGGESPIGAARTDEAALEFVGDEAFAPIRQHDGDAGYDMVTSERVAIPGHGFADIPLGVSVALPPGKWALLTGRSSTIRKRGLLVTQGVIDNGYRGSMFAGCWNLEPGEHVVEAGDRIAQLIVMPLAAPPIRRVASLPGTDRGTGGFGSTGT